MQTKNNLNRFLKINTIIILIILLITPISSVLSDNTGLPKIVSSSEKSDDIPYTGHLRLYIVEKESRWNDYSGKPYHFGFMDFAYNDVLSIDYLDTYTDSIIWNGDVDINNFMAIAAVFNPVAHQGFAQPPDNHPFEAYYVDATAGAESGTTTYNTVTDNFTHTVLIEEGTATW